MRPLVLVPPFGPNSATAQASRGARLLGCWLVVGGLAGGFLTPGSGAAQQTGRRSGWGFGVEGATEWDSNLRLESAKGGGDEVRRFTARMNGATHTPRTELSGAARGDVLSYRRLTDLNAVTYDVTGGVLRRVSPRLTTRVRAGALRRTSSDAAVGDGGVRGDVPVPGRIPLLPLVRSRTVEIGAGGAYRLSPTTSGRLDAAYDRTTYDSRLVTGGSTATVGAELRTRISALGALASTLDVERARLGTRRYWVQTAREGWEHRTMTFGVSANAGVAYVVPDAGQKRSLAPVGELAAAMISPQRVATLAYRHSVSPTIGVGRVLSTDDVGAAYAYLFRSGSRVGIAAGQAWSADVGDRGSRLSSTYVSSEIEHRLPGGVAIGAMFVQRRRDERETVSGTTLSAFARYDYGERGR
ncbi:MAG: hypothetical protein NVS9B3_04810 [Gemmatimonadaceae bacterium]